MSRRRILVTWAAAVLAAGWLVPQRTEAHCDGLDGPVVTAARQALANGQVNLALIWVQSGDEDVIRDAFRKTLVVRKLGPEARDLADQHFFETLVRVHRAGEDAPYTGLKPAGRDLGPVIPAADRAIASGVAEPLLRLLPAAAHTTVTEHFREVLQKKHYSDDDVAAGRAYVAAYVTFMHAVERFHHGGECEAGGHAVHAQAAEHHDGQHEPVCHAEHASGGHAPLATGRPAEHHAAHAGHLAQPRATAHSEAVSVPRPLHVEHEALHTVLVQATQEGGKTAAAAQVVAHLLHPHFVKEEQFALPALGLLVSVAQGKMPSEPQRVTALTDTLRTELPDMLAEHRAIVAALDKLAATAQAEAKPQYVRFAEQLKLHAETEEQVLYPAAIVLGEYLKLKTPK